MQEPARRGSARSWACIPYMRHTAVRRTLFATLSFALFLIACQRSDKPRIGVVPKAVAHLFWQSVHAGAVAAAQESGVEIEWNGPPSETDFVRQMEIVNAMITSRVDAIVLAPTQRDSLVPVVERAADEQIPVVIFDTAIDSERYASFVASDNYAAGALAAETLADLLGGSGKIVVVKTVPGSGSTGDRERGFEEKLRADFPGIQIIAEQFCMSDRAKAINVTENMLNANPDADGVFASAEPGTIGAAQAVKVQGKAGTVALVGFDFSSSVEEDLRGGAVSATIVQDPFQIGYRAVSSAVAALNGEAPPRRIDTPVRVVTKANLDEPEIDKLVHPDLDRYLK